MLEFHRSKLRHTRAVSSSEQLSYFKICNRRKKKKTYGNFESTFIFLISPLLKVHPSSLPDGKIKIRTKFIRVIREMKNN